MTEPEPSETMSEPMTASRHEVWFWVAATTEAMIIIVGVTLNSLVIRFTNQKSLTGTFPHLNATVRQLAVSDLLYGLLACPLMTLGWKMSKI